MNRPPRKHSLRWMQSRLRRLHTIKHPSERQVRRAFRLRFEIAKLTT